MKLQAVKLGIATAIVSALFVLVGRLLLLAAPFGPIRGGSYAGPIQMHGGYMMRGFGGAYHWGRMGGLAWGVYFAGLVIGLVVVPLVTGVAAWGTATIYNRLLDRKALESSAPADEPAD